jgi:hypothetical protein
VKFLYGFDRHHPNEQCAVDPAKPGVGLCGREVVFLPAHDREYTPSNLHDRCRDLIWGGRRPRPSETDEVEYGVCPDCGGDAPVFDGVMQQHARQVVRAQGIVRLDESCTGEGQPPEVSG